MWSCLLHQSCTWFQAGAMETVPSGKGKTKVFFYTTDLNYHRYYCPPLHMPMGGLSFTNMVTFVVKNTKFLHRCIKQHNDE